MKFLGYQKIHHENGWLRLQRAVKKAKTPKQVIAAQKTYCRTKRRLGMRAVKNRLEDLLPVKQWVQAHPVWALCGSGLGGIILGRCLANKSKSEFDNVEHIKQNNSPRPILSNFLRILGEQAGVELLRMIAHGIEDKKNVKVTPLEERIPQNINGVVKPHVYSLGNARAMHDLAHTAQRKSSVR